MGDEYSGVEDWAALGGAKKAGRRRRAVKGGQDGLRGTSELRVRIAYTAIQAFKADYDKPERAYHYLKYTTSLLKCLKDECAKDDSKTFEAVLPLVDLCPMVSFYLLLQPYRQLESGCLISEELIQAWAPRLTKDVAEMTNAQAVAAYLSFFDVDLKAVYLKCGIDQAAVEVAIDSQRQMVTKPLEARSKIIEMYKKFQTTGKIGEQQALPKATIELIGQCHDESFLMWADTFRATISTLFETARRTRGVEAFQKMIEYLYCSMPCQKCCDELTFLSDSVASCVAPRDFLLGLYKFMNSSDFEYRANTTDQVGDAAGSRDPKDDEIFNRNERCMKWLKSIK